MKELFKNEIMLTEELNLQYAKASYKKYRKKYRIGIMIFALVDFVVACLLIMDQQYLFAALFVLMAFLFYLVASKGYGGGTKKAYDNLKDVYKSTPRLFATFYDDHFERNTNQGNISLQYDTVTDVLETDDLYTLMVGKQGTVQQGIILDKAGFRTGNLESFRIFIQGKCPDIKK